METSTPPFPSQEHKKLHWAGFIGYLVWLHITSAPLPASISSAWVYLWNVFGSEAVATCVRHGALAMLGHD